VDPRYHSTLVASAIAEATAKAEAERWPATLASKDNYVFVRIRETRSGFGYLARIDLSRYPVEPYELGFFSPSVSEEDLERLPDTDPRFWPSSPTPGLDGSFHTRRPGAIRAFWCRPCTTGYFFYHVNDVWSPVDWPLHRVIGELLQAVAQAQHPRSWRSVERPVLIALAAQSGMELPENAGIDDG
jgi:hypothetical protein